MDAPLSERLAAYADKMREVGSPFVDAYDCLVARLRAGHLGDDAPAVGSLMPPFLLPDQDGRLVSPDELVAAGPLVVSFNRGHWCSFCRIEMNALADAHEDLVGLGAQIISIMPERAEFIGKLSSRLRSRLRILSDIDNDYALSLGLGMWVGDDLRHLLLQRGLCFNDFHGNGAWMLPLPATFVVGGNGRV